MRVIFALPGFHAVDRGAEVALLSVASELARGGDQVTVVGSGRERPQTAYRFVHCPAIARERFEWLPSIPLFRNETAWEDASFATGLLRRYCPAEYDVAVTCSFPFTHWALRRSSSGTRPLQIFVTQNGDWPAVSDDSEYRWFDCDGLVCTNPDFEARNRNRWSTALIPNGIKTERYRDIASARTRFGLPEGVPIILMVSAFIDTKRVLDGIRAVAALPDAHLVVAGDGPLRHEADALASSLLPGRYTRLTAPADAMPHLYASADTFLHMSLLEAFGNVFVEAMASGLPIVGHDSSRLRWIVGDLPTLCDTQDQPALIAALAQALAVGRGAPDPRSADFGWPAIAARYRAFFNELLVARGWDQSTMSRK